MKLNFKRGIIIAILMTICSIMAKAQDNNAVIMKPDGVYWAFINDSPPINEILKFSIQDTIVYRFYTYDRFFSETALKLNDYSYEDAKGVKYQIFGNKLVFDFENNPYECIVENDEIKTIIYDGNSKKKDQVIFKYKSFSK